MDCQQWRRKVIYLVIVMLLVLGWMEVRAESVLLDQIEFGKITATEEVQEFATYYLDSPTQAEMVQLRLTTELTCLATGESLSGERLQIRGLAGEYYQLSQKTLSFPLESTDPLVPLVLSVQIFPTDPPGIYESTLNIEDSQGQHLKTLQLLLEIKPWVLLQTEWEQIELADYQRNFSLSNQVPIILKVKANAPWKIYGLCMGDESVLKAGLEVALAGGESTGVQLATPKLYLTAQPQLVVTGQSTRFQKNNWLEMPINLKVVDYKNLVAGEQNLIISFKALTTGQSQSSY